MKNKIIFPIILVGILGIAVVVSLSIFGGKRAQEVFLESYGLAGMDIKEIVYQLDSQIDEPRELVSSINGEKLSLSDGKTSVELDLPDDSFYLSFAPYENTTHPCAFHSLSSCRGELVNVPVYTTITDENGTIIIEEEMETMANGFIGVWLPKNIRATIEVSYNGKVASAPISTFTESETCLTTPMKLN